MFKYSIRQVFSVLALILVSTPLMSSANAENLDKQRPRSIQVSGSGKISAAPDKADLTLSVEIQAKTAESASVQAASAMEALIKAVKDAGVAEKDIQTRSVSLYPSYSGDAANRIVGYQLANQVAVCIRAIDKTSDIIDVAVKAGGNAARVQGITFGIEDPEPAMSKARALAYANAKMKAEEYAKLAGVSLAAPLHINEGNQLMPTPRPYGEMVQMKAAMADAATPVQAGEQDVSVNVDVVFGIQ